MLQGSQVSHLTFPISKTFFSLFICIRSHNPSFPAIHHSFPSLFMLVFEWISFLSPLWDGMRYAMEEVNNLSEDGKMKVVKAFLQEGSQEIHKRCIRKGCLNKIGENQQKIRCCGLRLKQGRIPDVGNYLFDGMEGVGKIQNIYKDVFWSSQMEAHKKIWKRLE